MSEAEKSRVPFSDVDATTDSVRMTNGALHFAEAPNSGIPRNADDPMGVERATPELIDHMRTHGRRINTAKPGSDDLRMLEYFKAEASVGGEDYISIILRENPSKAAALEEFLHGTQHRLGIIERLGREGAEGHVKDFMIRHRRLLRLRDEDVETLRKLRDMEQ